jgi:hypothetical protein
MQQMGVKKDFRKVREEKEAALRVQVSFLSLSLSLSLSLCVCVCDTDQQGVGQTKPVSKETYYRGKRDLLCADF